MKEVSDLQKAISLVEQAAGILKKSQQSFDFSIGNGHDHHVAYTRTNASGTVSNIQAKGAAPAPVISPKTYKANNASADAQAGGTAHFHNRAAIAHKEAANAYHPTTSQHREHLDQMEHHLRQANSLKPALPSTHGAASEQAEIASKHAWTEDDTQVGHDAAEVANVNAASAHDSAAHEATLRGDTATSKWHNRKADMHRQMAEEHGAESHRQWTAEQQAKQVAAANAKLAAEKAANPEKHAASQLRKLADKHYNSMARKPANWNEIHTYGKEVPASAIEGTETRHFTTSDIFGPGPQRYKDGPEKGQVQTLQDFTDSFKKKLAESNHEPFVLKHTDGKRYLVDTQGSDYMRYMSPIKEETSKKSAANPHDYSQWEDHVTEEVVKQGKMDRSDAQGVVEVHHMKNKGHLQLNHTNGTSPADAAKMILSQNKPAVVAQPPQGAKASKVHVPPASAAPENDRAAAKSLKTALESDDFGMTEKGGNGRVKQHKDGSISVYDGYYYGGDQALSDHVKKWSEGGHMHNYFKDEGYNIKVTGTEQEHKSSIFKRAGSTHGGHVAVKLHVTKK